MSQYERILELSNQGFACAQILMQMVLDAEDSHNPDLIRTIGALNNGLRDCGQACGALTGGLAMIAFYAGQGEPDEIAAPGYDALAQELFTWFSRRLGERYGGITCPQILDGDPANKAARCPGIVEECLDKAIEMLANAGLV